jgi:hypothetical protein
MAPQQRMGILSQRRPWIDPYYLADSATDGPDLTPLLGRSC